MRQIIYIIALCFVVNIGMAQGDVASLFSKYSEMKDITHFNFGGDMFGKSEDANIKSQVSKVEIILVPETLTEAIDDFNNLESYARASQYEPFMEVKTKVGGKIRAFGIGEAETFSSLVFSLVSDTNNLLVKLDGTLYKSDLNQLDLENADGLNFLQGFK